MAKTRGNARGGKATIEAAPDDTEKYPKLIISALGLVHA